MSNRPQPQVLTFADADTLVTAAADALVGEIAGAVAARGVAHVVLTGGGAGINLARRLRDRSDVDWAAVQLYWGDDRYVPAADPDRNELQARQALLDGIDIPAANVHPMPASDGQFGDNLDAAAAAYELLLSGLADGGAPTPVFDVHLLGMLHDDDAVGPHQRHVVGGERGELAQRHAWIARRTSPENSSQLLKKNDLHAKSTIASFPPSRSPIA